MKEIVAHVFFNGKYAVKSISIEDKRIIFEDTDKKPDFIVLSGFVNAHTHIGDSFIENVPRISVMDLVGPGGFKQKMLENASKSTIIKGMKKSLKIMEKENLRAFFDFREGGIEGLKLIKSLKFDKTMPMILARPGKNILDYDEIEYLLNNSAGIGMSSISDYDYKFLTEISKITKEKGKLFAIHASEREREDIDKILNLNPDFLVHMHKAEDYDLEKVREKNVPIVICPRSGLFFNIKMDISRFLKKGISIALGTDNAMISIPSIRIEMLFASLLFNVDPIEILKTSTITMDRFLSRPESLMIFKNSPYEFIKNPYIRPVKILNIKNTIIEL